MARTDSDTGRGFARFLPFLLPTCLVQPTQPMHPSPVQPSQTYDVPIKTEERVRVRSTTTPPLKPTHPIKRRHGTVD